MLRLWSEENLLKRVFVQIPHVPCAIVILAIARNCQIAVYCNIIFRLAGQGGAVKPLAAKFRGGFQVKLQPLANNVADEPIKSSLFHAASALVSCEANWSIAFLRY